MSARLHRTLSRDPKLGSLVAPSRRRTQSEGGTLELLLTAHFPKSEVTEMEDPAAARRAGCSDWRVAARVVTYRRVEWTMILLPHTEVQKWMAYCRACCKRDVGLLSLVRIFRACMATDYISAIWCQVIVCLYLSPEGIPLADLGILDLTVSYRSHLKTLERMVDRYAREETLALVPVHPNQHAYQAGKSVETALHHLVVRGEKAFD